MKKIVVFGRGAYFKRKDMSAFEIVAFLDNAVLEEEYDDLYHCYAYNPRRWKEIPNYPIVCMSTSFIAMWKQLVELEVPENRIEFGVDIEPFFYEYEKVLFEKGYLLSGKTEIKYIDECNNRYNFSNERQFKEIIRSKFYLYKPEIELISKIGTIPVSRIYGGERGLPVDRKYIEKFLLANKGDICGTVMEIESDDYIKKYGESIDKKYILHVKGWGGKDVIQGNFETGEGLLENMVDCLICTQTLQYIFDLERAIDNIHKILRPNGVALITVPSIQHFPRIDNNDWCEYWSFTENSVKKLLANKFGEDAISVKSFGNVKVTTAFLEGLCAEELCENDFMYNDRDYPCVITARAKKR